MKRNLTIALRIIIFTPSILLSFIILGFRLIWELVVMFAWELSEEMFDDSMLALKKWLDKVKLKDNVEWIKEEEK